MLGRRYKLAFFICLARVTGNHRFNSYVIWSAVDSSIASPHEPSDRRCARTNKLLDSRTFGLLAIYPVRVDAGPR